MPPRNHPAVTDFIPVIPAPSNYFDLIIDQNNFNSIKSQRLKWHRLDGLNNPGIFKPKWFLLHGKKRNDLILRKILEKLSRTVQIYLFQNNN